MSPQFSLKLTQNHALLTAGVSFGILPVEKFAKRLFSRELQALHALSPEERRKIIEKEKNRFLNHLAAFPHWKTQAENLKGARLTRSDLNENFSQLISQNYPAFTLFSSGSTGEPVKFLVDKRTFGRRVAMPYYALFLYTGTIEHTILRLSFSDMPWSKLQGCYLNPGTLDREQVKQFLQKLKPNVVYGTVSHVLLLAEFFEKENIRHPLDVILTRSELLSGGERMYLERVFGAKAYSIYASREFGPLGQECAMQNGFHVNEETFDVERAENGEALITYFHNYSLPFLRYEIGDLIEAINKPCPCGLTTKRIRVIGRTADFIVLPGRKIPLTDVLPSFGFPEMIKTFQITQKSTRGLEVQIIPKRGAGTREHETIAKKLHQTLKTDSESFAISVKNAEDIPLSPNGKRRLFISRLDTGRA